MKKKVLMGLVGGVALLVAGCEDGFTRANYPVRPPELADCSIYYLTNSGGGNITVVRCPNSTTSTTYPVGKSRQTSVVIDGVVYEPTVNQ